MDYLLYLSKVLEYISFVAVNVKCTSNGHETAVRTAPVHRSSSGIKLSSTRDNFNDVCANLLHSIWRPQDMVL